MRRSHVEEGCGRAAGERTPSAGHEPRCLARSCQPPKLGRRGRGKAGGSATPRLRDGACPVHGLRVVGPSPTVRHEVILHGGVARAEAGPLRLGWKAPLQSVGVREGREGLGKPGWSPWKNAHNPRLQACARSHAAVLTGRVAVLARGRIVVPGKSGPPDQACRPIERAEGPACQSAQPPSWHGWMPM